MTTTKVPTTLSVCVDCLFYLANGEVIDGDGNDITEDQAYDMARIWGDGFDITLGATDCEYCPTDELADCEPWFSWQQCDGCGSRFGGDRVHATAWT